MLHFENHPLHPGGGVPIFIAAGPLKEPAQLEPFINIEDPLAVPLLTLGGFTLTAWSGNGEPDFTYDRIRKAAGNSRGLPNGGKEAIIALKEPIRRLGNRGIKTIIQVTNLPHENPLDVLPELVEIGAESNPTAVEINFGCPNGKMPDGSFHPPLYRMPEACGEVLEAVRERVGYDITLGIKDGPHTDSPDVLPDAGSVMRLADVVSPYIDVVCGINTIAAQDFPELTRTGGKGGMSGPIVAAVAKEHARLWNGFAPDVPCLNTGGIDSENAETEIPERLASPNVFRVGGAQEFYRAIRMRDLAATWAIAAA